MGLSQTNTSELYFTACFSHAGMFLFCFFLSENSAPLRGRVLRFTEACYLRSDSPRTSPRNKIVKLSRRQMIMASFPMTWPSWTWCCTGWNRSWHSCLKSALFCPVRPRTPLVYRTHAVLRFQSHSAVFGCSPSGSTKRHPPRPVTLE